MRGIWPAREQLGKLAQAAGYDANNLARLCQVSSRQLQRYFCREFGRSPQGWLDELRIEAAGELLLAGEPLKKVALDLGFKHSSHFCRKFKRQKKMTASEFVSAKSFCVVMTPWP